MIPQPVWPKSLASIPSPSANEVWLASARSHSAAFSGLSRSSPIMWPIVSSASPLSGRPLSAEMPHGIGITLSVCGIPFMPNTPLDRRKGRFPDGVRHLRPGDVAVGAAHSVAAADEPRPVEVVDLAL